MNRKVTQVTHYDVNYVAVMQRTFDDPADAKKFAEAYVEAEGGWVDDLETKEVELLYAVPTVEVWWMAYTARYRDGHLSVPRVYRVTFWSDETESRGLPIDHNEPPFEDPWVGHTPADSNGPSSPGFDILRAWSRDKDTALRVTNEQIDEVWGAEAREKVKQERIAHAQNMVAFGQIFFGGQK